METVLELSVQRIDATEELEEITPEWQDLWGRCPNATVFQSPQWLVHWWKVFSNDQLIGFAFRKDERLVGIVLLYLLQEAADGPRELLQVGVALSDYLDPLIEPGFERECMESLFRELSVMRDDWDTLILQQLRSSGVLQIPASSGWHDEISEQDVCTYFPLPGSVEELHRRWPKSMAQNIRTCWHRCEKLAAVRLESVTAENLDALLSSTIHLHNCRRSAFGKPSAWENKTLQRFLRSVCREFLKMRVLRLYALRLNERVVATSLGFFYNRQTSLYMTGIDPMFPELSLGSLITSHAMESAVRDGAECFDFLRGQERYKTLWGVQSRANYCRMLSHQS